MGYRGMWHRLRMKYNITVSRDTIMYLLQELDPEGILIRRRHKLQRRQFISSGPNNSWHADGYDKLKRYGFPIHGCIDAFSRKVLWLTITRSNNNPLVPAYFFLKSIRDRQVVPRLLQTDCGTENGMMAALQCTVLQDINAHRFGKSTANQRIENFWSHFRRGYSDFVISFFKTLVSEGVYMPCNYVHRECAWFSFSDLIKKELNVLASSWNSHYIRKSYETCIPGRPDVLYLLPESAGFQECGIIVTGEDLDQSLSEIDEDILQQARLAIDEKDDELTEYFQHLVQNDNLNYPPNTWTEAEYIFRYIISCNL